MLMPPCWSVALLPALSMQVPVADWFAPSVAIVCESAAATTPDSASEHVQSSFTDVAFQPAPFAAGVWPENAIAGAVLSMLIPDTVAAAAVFPALSVQAPVFVTDWFAPSPVT